MKRTLGDNEDTGRTVLGIVPPTTGRSSALLAVVGGATAARNARGAAPAAYRAAAQAAPKGESRLQRILRTLNP